MKKWEISLERIGIWNQQIVSNNNPDLIIAGTTSVNSQLIAVAPDLLEAAKGAVAALSQNKTFPADIKAAKAFLNHAIKKAEGKP
jgi:hypothetical protein